MVKSVFSLLVCATVFLINMRCGLVYGNDYDGVGNLNEFPKEMDPILKFLIPDIFDANYSRFKRNPEDTTTDMGNTLSTIMVPNATFAKMCLEKFQEKLTERHVIFNCNGSNFNTSLLNCTLPDAKLISYRNIWQFDVVVIVRNCSLSLLSKWFYEKFNYIVKLDVTNVGLKSIQTPMLLSHLNWLNLSHNHLQIVLQNWFLNSHSLVVLDLSFNRHSGKCLWK